MTPEGEALLLAMAETLQGLVKLMRDLLERGVFDDN